MGKLVDSVKRFQKDYVHPPEIEKVEKDNIWLHNELHNAGFLSNGMKKLNLDTKRWVCSQEDFVKWIIWDWTNCKRYIAEEYDCDNFAFSFKARTDRKLGINCVGLVIDYSGGHAYNVVAFSDARPKLYEPQGDRWKEVGDPRSKTEMYKMVNGYIII